MQIWLEILALVPYGEYPMSSRKPILGVHHYSEETGISLVLPMGWLASEGPSTASFREGTGGEDGICSTSVLKPSGTLFVG